MCFRERAGQFSSPHIQKYVHNVANELSHDLDEIAISFKIFNKYGRLWIFFLMWALSTRRNRDSLHTVRTEAGFRIWSQYVHHVYIFLRRNGYYAASCTQFSVHNCHPFNRHYILVLFPGTQYRCRTQQSLETNYIVRRSKHDHLELPRRLCNSGTHGRRLLPWVTIWMHGSAPLFLTLSITCFSAGLVLFTYVSNQVGGDLWWLFRLLTPSFIWRKDTHLY